MQVQYPGDLGASAGMAALWTPPPAILKSQTLSIYKSHFVNWQNPNCQLIGPCLFVKSWNRVRRMQCLDPAPGSRILDPGSGIQDPGDAAVTTSVCVFFWMLLRRAGRWAGGGGQATGGKWQVAGRGCRIKKGHVYIFKPRASQLKCDINCSELVTLGRKHMSMCVGWLPVQSFPSFFGVGAMSDSLYKHFSIRCGTSFATLCALGSTREFWNNVLFTLDRASRSKSCKP